MRQDQQIGDSDDDGQRQPELSVQAGQQAASAPRDGDGGAPAGAGSRYPTRAAVVDMAPSGTLDPPVCRSLRLTPAVGAEGTSRKVTRHSKPFRDALAELKLQVLEAGLAEDAVRDWCACGLLADAILQLLEGSDVAGPMWRRLFDAWCRLQRMKADRREELRPVLSRLPAGGDALAAARGTR